jgi:hypothetical protein
MTIIIHSVFLSFFLFLNFCYYFPFKFIFVNFDTIQATKKQSDSDSDVKCAFVQVYDNNHDSQSDCWIGLKFYVESLECFRTLG